AGRRGRARAGDRRSRGLRRRAGQAHSHAHAARRGGLRAHQASRADDRAGLFDTARGAAGGPASRAVGRFRLPRLNQTNPAKGTAMANAQAAVRQSFEASADKATVRRILDAVKAQGRTSLTAPEGKEVCDAYGISVPQEGVATSASAAAKLAS